MNPYAEKNRETLRQALQALPAYEPGPLVWEEIDTRLQEEEDARHLRSALKGLPAYDPPAMLWENIAEELSADPPRRLPLRLPLRQVRRWSAAAAAAAVVLSSGVFWLAYRGYSPTKVSIVYSEEIIQTPPPDALADWDADAGEFQAVLTDYERYSWLQEEPEIRSLREELTELDAAKEEIKTMMSRYGQEDAGLIRQMGEIERQRGDILKKISSCFQVGSRKSEIGIY